MPEVFAGIVDQGVNFTRAYDNVALCCPSRASILTGLYAHHSGVENNANPLHRADRARPTFIRPLYQAGYRTMFAGKYLNSEPCQPRLGWDRWVCGVKHVDPALNIDGRTTPFKGFATDVLADQVIDFMRDPSGTDRPFFVYYSPSSPHLPADDPRARDVPAPYEEVPSFNVQPDPASLPAWARRQPFDSAQADYVKNLAERMAQQLPPLDANIGRILAELGPRASNTFVIFLSDDGFSYGEHRLFGKSMPYEESIRVPFVIRFPKLLPPRLHFSSPALVTNVDIAATLMDLAGIEWAGDGRSLVPILTGRGGTVRDELLVEWCQIGRDACVEEQRTRSEQNIENSTAKLPPPFWGIMSDRYVLIEYETKENELYDLARDPFQLRNLAFDPAFNSIRAALSARLIKLRAESTTPETTIAVGPSGSVASSTVWFEFFSPALKTKFRCRLTGPGGTRVGSCDEGRVSYSGLEPGDYTFRVEAIDSDGDVDPAPAERQFSIAERS